MPRSSASNTSAPATSTTAPRISIAELTPTSAPGPLRAWRRHLTKRGERPSAAANPVGVSAYRRRAGRPTSALSTSSLQLRSQPSDSSRCNAG